MNPETSSSIGNVIADLRKQRGVTQQQMAERVGISTQAVSKWETGASLPDVAILPAIADYLEVSIDRLFNRDGDSKQRSSNRPTNDVTVSAMMRRCWDVHLSFYYDKSRTHEIAQEMAESTLTSIIATNDAFSNIRNGLGYVFLPEPENGWIHLFDDTERLVPIFRALSEPDCFCVLKWMIGQNANFTPEAASAETGISVERCEELFHLLKRGRLLTSEKLRAKGGEIETFKTNKDHLPSLLVVIAFSCELAKENEAYNYYVWNRSKPLV